MISSSFQNKESGLKACQSVSSSLVQDVMDETRNKPL
jgi:hypothetical protein